MMLKNTGEHMIYALFLIFMCWLLFFNINVGSDFCKINISEYLAIVIACVISYYLKGQKEDNIRRSGCIEHIILEIESQIESDELFSKNRRIALAKQRSCANRLKNLQGAVYDFQKQDISLIIKYVEDIRDLYSDNETIYNENSSEYYRIKDLIIDKCVKIRISLYR